MSRNKNVDHHVSFKELYTMENILHDGLWIQCDTSIPDIGKLYRYFRSDFFQIVLMKKGSTEHSVNLRNYKAKYRDLITGTPYDIKKLNGAENCVHSILLFTSDFIKESGTGKYASELLHTLSSGHSPQSSLDYHDFKAVNAKMTELQKLYQKQSQHLYGKELLYLAFASLLYEVAAARQKYSTHVNAPLSRKEHIVLNFIHLVKEHFREQRSLSFYASKLHITPKYLTETTKAISGKSASTIIEGIVNEEAMMLLDNPALSISEVATMLNFSDQSFFGKFFKRGIGISPKNYRNSLKRNKE